MKSEQVLGILSLATLLKATQHHNTKFSEAPSNYFLLTNIRCGLLIWTLFCTILNENVYSWDTRSMGKLRIKMSYFENEEFMEVTVTSPIGMLVSSTPADVQTKNPPLSPPYPTITMFNRLKGNERWPLSPLKGEELWFVRSGTARPLWDVLALPTLLVTQNSPFSNFNAHMHFFCSDTTRYPRQFPKKERALRSSAYRGYVLAPSDTATRRRPQTTTKMRSKNYTPFSSEIQVWWCNLYKTRIQMKW